MRSTSGLTRNEYDNLALIAEPKVLAEALAVFNESNPSPTPDIRLAVDGFLEVHQAVLKRAQEEADRAAAEVETEVTGESEVPAAEAEGVSEVPGGESESAN